MTELESTLRLSVIYTKLLRDIEEVGNFEFTPEERHRCTQLCDDAGEAAHQVKLQAFAERWQETVGETLPEVKEAAHGLVNRV